MAFERTLPETMAPTETDHGDGRKHYEHPAFAQVSAHRVTGSRVLYGSDFEHHSFIRIHIGESTLDRDLSHDWYHSGIHQIVEFDLSEAQWATFVSSLNMGSGTPCTLYTREGVGLVPGLPEPVRRVEQFKSEVAETLADIGRNIDKALAAVEAAGIPKGKAAEIRAALNKARQEAVSNVPFVANSFDKHMETTVEAAKVELHGYISGTLASAGLAALQAPISTPALEPPKPEGEKL